ncbi:MAG: EAL domain-containing protein, partial [Devosia nanyangense]|nr:EAL domain-containing protein [Devosia nanyangense]
GTGYSSLAYLLKFAFDKVKIDHSLIEAAPHDPVARDLLRAIASIGKTLKLRITAEGIETREQAEFISEMLFYQLQGFYFAKPLDAIGLPHYLLTQVRSRAEDVRLEAQHVIAGLSAAG